MHLLNGKLRKTFQKNKNTILECFMLFVFLSPVTVLHIFPFYKGIACIYLENLGRPKCQKKSDIQQNLLFEDPGWERLENLKYRNFWSFQVFSGSSQALAALSIT